MLFQTKAFQITVWLTALAALVWVGQHIGFVFYPAVILVTTVAFPVIVAGLLYYLTKPIVDQLVRWKVPKNAAIILLFLVVAALLGLVGVQLVPVLQHQFESLVRNLPTLMEELDRLTAEFQESNFLSQVEQFEFFERWATIDYMKMVDGFVDNVLANFLYYVGSIFNIFVVLFTIPFFWFYMLKDGKRIAGNFIRSLPDKYQEESASMLSEMSRTLSNYIQGVLLVSLFVGTFVYVGYLIIGVDYALLLAFVALVTNVIPYFGPVIGTIPGLVVALIQSPWTAMQVLIMVVIVQQLESQLVAPQVYGRKLKVHPITIIIVLLTAGSLGGLVGIILGVPIYATTRVVITHSYRMFRASSAMDIQR